MLKATYTRVITAIAISVLAVGMSGCKSSRKVTARAVSAVATPPEKKSNRATNYSSFPMPTASLLQEADLWLGTMYRYGGNDHNGVDCSGLVTQIYYRALDIKLPRTTAQQIEYCRSLRRDEMLPGDLVFFRSPRSSNVSHVGMYIGDGNMIHASSTLGVVKTSLSAPYFARNYLGAGRVARYSQLLAETNRQKSKKQADVRPEKKEQPTFVASDEESVAIIIDFFD